MSSRIPFGGSNLLRKIRKIRWGQGRRENERDRRAAASLKIYYARATPFFLNARAERILVGLVGYNARFRSACEIVAGLCSGGVDLGGAWERLGRARFQAHR